MKVFIVEDSVIVRGRIMVMLSAIAGVSICGVSGIVEESLRLIESKKPDVVLIDLKIFGGSGLDVLKDVKRLNPSAVAIVLTNYAFQQYRDKCRELGADYFFDKSTEFEKAFEVIASLAPGGETPRNAAVGT